MEIGLDKCLMATLLKGKLLSKHNITQDMDTEIKLKGVSVLGERIKSSLMREKLQKECYHGKRERESDSKMNAKNLNWSHKLHQNF